MQISADASKTPAGASRITWAAIVSFVSAVLVFLLGFHFDGGPAGYDIDPSWAAAVISGVEHSRHWGRDIVFTYGPLGLLSPQASYNASMLFTVACGQVAFAALYALLFWFACSALALSSRLIVLLIVLWFGSVWAGDVLWFTVHPIALLAMWRVRDGSAKLSVFIAIAAGIACGIPWLIKFSIFLLWVVWLLCTPLAMSASRRNGMLAVASSVITSLLLWRLAGQDFSDILNHLHKSAQVAIGYGQAMQRPGPEWTDTIGFATLSLALMALAAVFWRIRLGNAERIAFLVLAAAAIGLSFKAAFTRVDPTHLLVFFPTAGIAIALTSAFAQSISIRRLGEFAALACAAGAFALPSIRADQKAFLAMGAPSIGASLQNGERLLFFKARADRLEQVTDEMRASNAMPQTQRTVGQDTIDIVSVGQGLLFLNRLNYRPRPILQGYSAYTPELAEMNRGFFASARAPQWVLLDFRAIDGRMPTSEDPLALQHIIQTYSPRQSERGLMLMQRNPGARAVTKPLSEAVGLLNEFISVPSRPNQALTLSVDIKPSSWGQAAGVLHRSPRLYIDLELGDGSKRSYRIVPGAARSGFLLSPLIEGTQSLRDWLVADKSERVLRVRLRGESWLGHPGFEPEYRLRYSELILPPRAGPPLDAMPTH